ncbi:hypothetical protein B0H13DRAFT_2332029 [Mycena leptocephala]|nr:hypothetical protein B0H13DRAFT_2332029 [Mycena leptocephala]
MNHAFPGLGRGSSARRNHTTSLGLARTHDNVHANYCAQITWGSRRAASKLLT